MPNLRLHFETLLQAIEPSRERKDLVARVAGDVRDWLAEHDFPTCTPHTRLVGSYSRQTAIELIPDVDILAFIGDEHAERTPNAVLLELHRALQEYPGGAIDTRGQRRSVRLSLPALNVHLDLVAAISPDGLSRPLRVPDRPRGEWIQSDPLGYGERLSRLNEAHGLKVVPLMKLMKAWRDEQMPTRKPKSYVLEVMLVHAIEAEELVLAGRGYSACVHGAFDALDRRYRNLFESGKESPRVPDPQIPSNLISKGWERSHFETFMRRIGEARAAAEQADEASTEQDAIDAWKRVFGSRWPALTNVQALARREAAEHQPGTTPVGATGLVVGAVGRTVSSLPTRFHGEE